MYSKFLRSPRSQGATARTRVEYEDSDVCCPDASVDEAGLDSGSGTSLQRTLATKNQDGSNDCDRRKWWLTGLLIVWGPGLVVMLADTDAGSLITAAQSGARWGYTMLLPQIVLIPVLFLVQEMTVRLGVHTGLGHGALIKDRFGAGWAWLSTSTLFLSAIGALITEFAAVAGVGELFGVPRDLTVSLAAVFLVGIGLTGSYKHAERVAVALGLMELVFIPAMILAHPKFGAVARDMWHLPLGHGSYVVLLAANVGAVIMPWMIFYQQGAVIDKRLRARDIRSSRRDTAVGAVLTQVIMIVTIITFAATLGLTRPGAALNSVGEMSAALLPFMGPFGSKILLGASVLGAAMVAALVASLAGAWGLAEATGWPHSLNGRPGSGSSKFYWTYVLIHLVGAGLVLTNIDLVSLVVDVMVMNALLLPIVLGFLLILEAKALPPDKRMRGAHRFAATSLSIVVILFGLFLVPAGFLWHLRF